MTFEIAFVLLSLLGMVIALILDKMRPGMILFSVVVLFLCGYFDSEGNARRIR